MSCVREYIEEQFPDWKYDTVDGWKLIDTGEKYGRIRYNEALEDLKKYIDAGWVINKINIGEIIKRLEKPVE